MPGYSMSWRESPISSAVDACVLREKAQKTARTGGRDPNTKTRSARVGLMPAGCVPPLPGSTPELGTGVSMVMGMQAVMILARIHLARVTRRRPWSSRTRRAVCLGKATAMVFAWKVAMPWAGIVQWVAAALDR